MPPSLFSRRVSFNALQFLELGKELAEGFHPITEQARLDLSPPADPRADWEERVEPFRSGLPPQGETRCIVLRDLMVLVALRCGYDARTRYEWARTGFARGFRLLPSPSLWFGRRPCPDKGCPLCTSVDPTDLLRLCPVILKRTK